MKDKKFNNIEDEKKFLIEQIKNCKVSKNIIGNHNTTNNNTNSHNTTNNNNNIIKRKSEILHSCFENIKNAITETEKNKYDTYKTNRDRDIHHRNNIILDIQIDIVNDYSTRDDLHKLGNIFNRNKIEN